MRSVLVALLAAGALAIAGSSRAAAPVEAYGALPAIDHISISPDGTRVATIVAGADQRGLVIMEVDGGKILQKMGVGPKKVRLVTWADDDHVFVVTSETEYAGMVNAQEAGLVFLVNARTGKYKQIQPAPDMDTRGTPLVTTHVNGRAYGYFRSPKGIERVDLDSLQEVLVVKGRENEGSYALSPAGEVLARTEAVDHGQQWRVLKGLNSFEPIAQGRNPYGAGFAVAHGRTPDSLLLYQPDDNDFDAFREVSLTTGKIGEPLVQGVDSGAIRDRKTRLLIGFRLGGEVQDYEFLDPALQAKWQSVRAAFKDKKVNLESYDDAFDRWVVEVEGPNDSGHFYLVDTKAKRALPLGAQYPGVKAEDVGAFQWFHYTAKDGTKLNGVLTLPPGKTIDTARNLPLVMLPHGGPAGHDTPRFDWWAQALASRGYAVFQPNFRGSDGFGQKFERAGWGQWGKLMQSDVSDAIPALAASGMVDPRRACIVGWSYGGYATLAGVTVQNGLYRCAVAGGAVSDLNAMLVWEQARHGKLAGVMRYWKASMALKGVNDPAADAVSPAKVALKTDAPLMLIHGFDDSVVPFSQAEEMREAVTRSGKYVQLVRLDGEDHWLSSGKTRTDMLKAMVGFLERYNPATTPVATVASAAPAAP
jgi:dipeptidyl aminopeptidase/acylaminoacyl peptidase